MSVTIVSKILSESAILRLQDKVNKMNRRAERIGADPLVMTVGPFEVVTREAPSGLDYSVRVAQVDIAGSLPCIEGWEVIGRVEFVDGGNLVHLAPHVDSIDSRYRTIGPICEHCNTDRRRNDIIILRHSDGSEKCVGRNCCADFVRSGDAEHLLLYASYSVELDDSDDMYYSDSRVNRVETPLTILTAASICIRKLGWKSSKDYMDSTKNDVFALLYPPKDYDNRKKWKKWIEDTDLKVSDYDKDLAARALEWMQSLQSSQSEYLYNLSILARQEYVSTDKFGYIVSAIPAYNKEYEREMKRKENEAKKGSKVFYGEPGKRIKGIKATCVGLNSFDGYYGVTTLVRFEYRISDSEYAVLIWFASGDKIEDFELGKEYTFDATCKNHDDHEKYGKQTKINRLTVK